MSDTQEDAQIREYEASLSSQSTPSDIEAKLDRLTSLVEDLSRESVTRKFTTASPQLLLGRTRAENDASGLSEPQRSTDNLYQGIDSEPKAMSDDGAIKGPPEESGLGYILHDSEVCISCLRLGNTPLVLLEVSLSLFG